MCESLCDPVNKYEFYMDYKLVDCFNQKPTKDENNRVFEIYDEFKAVLVYELANKNGERTKNRKRPNRLVLKSRQKFFLDFDTHLEFDFKEKPIFDQLEYLSAYFESTLESKYGVKIDKKNFQTWLDKYKEEPDVALLDIDNSILQNDLNYYIKLFSIGNFDDYLKALRKADTNELATFIQNLLILMSQDEYLFYRFFQSKPGTLKIHGSCGHFYLVEYAEPLTYKVRLMDLNERKTLSLKFLDLVHNLDTTYLLKRLNSRDEDFENNSIEAKANPIASVPIQMCDVKLDNFGINQNGELKIIDTDMAYTNVYLFNTKVCNKHDDCHFFDCKSFCDPISSKCVKTRINNNLQSVCEKIFDNAVFKKDGILSGVDDFGSNVNSEIIHRLDTCKSPGFYHGSDVPVGANKTLIRVFNVLLQDRGIKLQ